MSTSQPGTSQKKLLTPKQKTACELISEVGNNDSPRAKALLLVHAGSTQAEAAEQSGLSLGQVKYWITRFRNIGLACFTADMPVKPSESDKKKKDKKEKKKSKKADKKSKNKDDKKGKKKGKKDKNKKKK